MTRFFLLLSSNGDTQLLLLFPQPLLYVLVGPVRVPGVVGEDLYPLRVVDTDAVAGSAFTRVTDATYLEVGVETLPGSLGSVPRQRRVDLFSDGLESSGHLLHHVRLVRTLRSSTAPVRGYEDELAIFMA